MTTRLVLTSSFGDDRNFISYTKCFMQDYAVKTNADLKIVTDNNVEHSIYNTCTFFMNNVFKCKSSSIGRNNNKAYLLKVLLIMHYLNIYDQVLWLDDTCFVSKNCDDIFSKSNTPFSVVAYNEGSFHLFESSHIDKHIIKTLTNFDIDNNKYINTGVVLYNKGLLDILTFETLIKCHLLFTSPFVEQCFINFLLQYHNVELHFLSEKYNAILIDCDYDIYGSQKDPSQISESILNNCDNYIFHVTSFYKNRLGIIKHISKCFN